jgi:transcription termination factor Rho
MNIQELKLKSSEQLITQAEELGIENASTLRKQEILFAILKKLQKKKKLPELVYCNYYRMVLVF